VEREAASDPAANLLEFRHRITSILVSQVLLITSHRFRLGLLATLAIAACEQPTAPLDELDDAALAQFAEAVSESDDVRMPSLSALLKKSRETIAATDGGHEEGIRHFRAARRLALAAENAAAAGDRETAARLELAKLWPRFVGLVGS
jgi:hypothetical protein